MLKGHFHTQMYDVCSVEPGNKEKNEIMVLLGHFIRDRCIIFDKSIYVQMYMKIYINITYEYKEIHL